MDTTLDVAAALAATPSAPAAPAPLPHGRWLAAADPGYEAARRLADVNPRADRRPALIARCCSESDVVAALAQARRGGGPLTVRAGGHDVLGASACDGGTMLDLRGLDAVHVDAHRGIATVGGGVLAGALCTAAEAHGLVPVVGVHPEVGVAGLTLGGGLGLMLGRLGASCDQLVAARLVDAGGRVHVVDEASDPDLLWALKGGGGNFGVVTELTLRLHPEPPLIGGLLAWRGGLEGVLAFYAEQLRAMPDGLVVELDVFGLGQPVAVAVVCWAGDPAEGEAVLAPWRARPGLWVDTVAPARHADLRSRIGLDALLARVGLRGALKAAACTAPPPGLWRGGSMPGLDDATIAGLAAHAARARGTWTISLAHQLHGQACRVGLDDSPMPRPQGRLSFMFGRRWRDPAEAGAALQWVDEGLAAMEPLTGGGSYVNFLSRDDAASVRASYGEAWPRLVAVKRRLDPHNRFRGNRNIPPTGAPEDLR